MMHGGGWMRQLSVADDEKPKITWRLLRRVLAYGRPYRSKIIGMLVIIAITSAAINLWQRRLNAAVGEGVIYDLRVALYAHLQEMSLSFFTNTKIGELMSRLNNDVVGAQNAISNTVVNIITDLIQAATVLA